MASKALTGPGRAGASRYGRTCRASWRCSWCPVAGARASSSQRRARCDRRAVAGGHSYRRGRHRRGRAPPACRLGRRPARQPCACLASTAFPAQAPGQALTRPACVSVLSGSPAPTPGGWETDETVAEAAARESLEEAGVRGELQARGRRSRRPHGAAPRGSPCPDSAHRRSWGRSTSPASPAAASPPCSSCSSQRHAGAGPGWGPCRHGGLSAASDTLPVAQELEVWPERDERPRFWVSEPGPPKRGGDNSTCADGLTPLLPSQCLVPDALARCRHAWMETALRQWHSGAMQAGSRSNGAT